MTIATLAGHPPIAVALRRSARARRLLLRVSHTDGRITLSVPAALDDRTALAFLHEKEPWLRAALAGIPGQIPVRAGTAVPLRGVTVPIRTARIARVACVAGALLVPPDPFARRTGPRLAAFLKSEAYSALEHACARHAAALGRRHGPIALRDTRSRWGSCTSAGRLMFSWRLIMAPPEVLDYVAAHEVAHLAQMNHSSAFWAEVRRLRPDYETQRDWLRRHGRGLHRYVFTTQNAE